MIINEATILIYIKYHQVDYWQQTLWLTSMTEKKVAVLVSLQFDLFTPSNPPAFVFKATFQTPQQTQGVFSL